MKLITTIYDRAEILPHFLKYYSKLGVSEFIIGVDKKDDNPETPFIINEAKKYKCYIEDIDMGTHFNTLQKTEFQNVLKNKYTDQKNEWILIVDLDEFVDFNGLSIEQVIQECDKTGRYWARGIMVDRIAEDFKIKKEIDPNFDIFKQFPYISNFSLKIANAGCLKVNLMKAFVNIQNGHHCVVQSESPFAPYQNKIIVHHFKWFGNVLKSMQKMKEGLQHNNLCWYQEKKNMIDFIVKNNGILKTNFIFRANDL